LLSLAALNIPAKSPLSVIFSRSPSGSSRMSELARPADAGVERLSLLSWRPPLPSALQQIPPALGQRHELSWFDRRHTASF